MCDSGESQFSRGIIRGVNSGKISRKNSDEYNSGIIYITVETWMAVSGKKKEKKRGGRDYSLKR